MVAASSKRWASIAAAPAADCAPSASASCASAMPCAGASERQHAQEDPHIRVHRSIHCQRSPSEPHGKEEPPREKSYHVPWRVGGDFPGRSVTYCSRRPAGPVAHSRAGGSGSMRLTVRPRRLTTPGLGALGWFWSILIRWPPLPPARGLRGGGRRCQCATAAAERSARSAPRRPAGRPSAARSMTLAPIRQDPQRLGRLGCCCTPGSSTGPPPSVYVRVAAVDRRFDWFYLAGVVQSRLARHLEAAKLLKEAVALDPRPCRRVSHWPMRCLRPTRSMRRSRSTCG